MNTEKITAIIIGLSAAIILTIFGGWVFTQLWGWFVVPLLGVPYLSIAHGIGITMLTRFASYLEKNSSEESHLVLLIQWFVYTLTTLAIGWIVQFFI